MRPSGTGTEAEATPERYAPLSFPPPRGVGLESMGEAVGVDVDGPGEVTAEPIDKLANVGLGTR